ncbi:hypothetical protein [Pedobacter sp. NJ-S-72]
MPNNPNAILDHAFCKGKNTNEFELIVDLRLIRKFHKIAEFEAYNREQNILDNGETLYLNLDDDNSFMMDQFKMDIKIEDLIELSNFHNQIIKLKKQNIDLIHYHNLIYSAQQSITLEEQLFKEHLIRYSYIREKLQFLLKLVSHLQSKDIGRIELAFYSQIGSLKKKKIVLTNNQPDDLMKVLVTHYKNRMLDIYLPIINEVLQSKLNKRTIRYSDLETVISKLDDYVKANSKEAAQEHLRSTLLVYIRENKIFKSKPDSTVSDHPNSNEARLIYFILCTTGQRPVLLPLPNLENKWEGDLNNQNDRIINQVIKQFKKPFKHIASFAPKDSNIFEPYLSAFFE